VSSQGFDPKTLLSRMHKKKGKQCDEIATLCLEGERDQMKFLRTYGGWMLSNPGKLDTFIANLDRLGEEAEELIPIPVLPLGFFFRQATTSLLQSMKCSNG